jgi:predicted PurR-regulated permease PerM
MNRGNTSPRKDTSTRQGAPGERRLSPAAATIILVVVAIVLLVVVWQLRLAIELYLISALFALAISPIIDWLEVHRVPRLGAIAGMLVLIVGALAGLGVVFVPRLAAEIAELVNHLPGYVDDLQARLRDLTAQYPWIQKQIAAADLYKEISGWARGFALTGWSFVRGAVGAIAATVLVLISAVFMLVNPRPLINGMLGLVPEPWAERAHGIAAMLIDRVRAWLRAVLIMGSVIGVAIGIGLFALGVPYAILFGLLAGVLETIPTLGPIISAIPPVLVALAQDPLHALWVIVLFFVVQQLESNLLAPFIMSRQLQLHPISTIFGILALGTLFGLFGAIVAVPAVACLKVLYDELYYPWAHPLPTAEAPAVQVPATAQEAADES